jgi:hypothetical protein
MQIANCKLKHSEHRQFAFCILHFAFCNLRSDGRHAGNRRGGVYIAVLGTSLIVSLLAISALALQRIQNRMLTAASDIHQAQLNAGTAVELGSLTIKQNSSWRSLRDGQLFLFTNRGTASASNCSLQALDSPTDATEVADRPIKLIGIGRHGPAAGDALRIAAEQRLETVVDPRRQPHDCLRNGSTAVPDVGAIFAYYGASPNGVGTRIDIASLPDRTPTFSRNSSLNDGSAFWTGNIPDSLGNYRDADDIDVGAYKGHTACLRVERNDWREGAANRLNAALLKPDTNYEVRLEIHPDFAGLLGNLQWVQFQIVLILEYPDGTFALSPNNIVRELRGNLLGSNWAPLISGSLRTPNWTQHPTAVYLFVNSTNAGNHHTDFYLDNVEFYESGARFIYQKVLSKDVNQLYPGAPTNASEGKSHGIYYIDCKLGGVDQKLVIERSRIFGTLLVLNPGADSRIAYGPIHWSPAIAGYPALLVGGSFTIQGTLAVDSRLRESENLVNYNPPGAAHRDFGTDDWADGVVAAEVNDYNARIHGLVGILGNVTYQFNPIIRGRVLIGGTVTGSAAFEYRPDSLLNPPPPLGGFYTYRYDRRPASTRKVVLP